MKIHHEYVQVIELRLLMPSKRVQIHVHTEVLLLLLICRL